MYSIWQSVKVTNDQHPRVGQAGTVHATNPHHPDEVVVKFDVDEQQEAVAVADLVGL